MGHSAVCRSREYDLPEYRRLLVDGDSWPQSDPTIQEGREAIFTEKCIVSYVRVHTIRVTDRFVSARVSVIPTRGLKGREGDDIAIGCVHEHLSLAGQIWVGREYCQWRVFFASEVIQEVLRIAASSPPDSMLNDYNEHYHALAKPLAEYQQRVAPHPDLKYLKHREWSQ
jgi:hypothetical protein